MANAPHEPPLFVLLGRRGAGKSTFVTSCGLSRGPDAQFVEIDVPDDARARDRECKTHVVELDKATRTRPIAGILVLVSLADLTNDACYAALRAALDAVVTGCGAVTPIHLVVTHFDRVPSCNEFLAATSRHPIALGVRLPLAARSDPNRWTAPIAKLTDAMFETSIALVHGAARSSPLRFGMSMRELAAPLAAWMQRLDTPTRGMDPLLVRSMFLASAPGRDATSLQTLAMQPIAEDAALARIGTRRLTKKALGWTLPVGIGTSAAAIAASLFIAFRSPPEPEPTAEAIAEAPTKAPKKTGPGFVPDARPIGPKFPPEVCAAASAASGKWAFQTMVTATNPGSESGIGIRGIYTLDLDATECNLDLTVTKTGFVSPAGSPTTYAKPQIGVDPIETAFVEASGDTEVLWLPVVLDMNNTSGTDPLKQEFIIGFRLDGGEAKRITGEWRQAGRERSAQGYWGYLEGGRDAIDPADASAQVCRVQCRLACGWSDEARVKRCREGCAADVLAAVTTCPS